MPADYPFVPGPVKPVFAAMLVTAAIVFIFSFSPAVSRDEKAAMPWIVPPEVISWTAEAEMTRDNSRVGRYSVRVTGTGTARKTETSPIGGAPWVSSFDLGLGVILDNPDDFIFEPKGIRSGLDSLLLKSRDLPELECLFSSDPGSGALVRVRIESLGKELLSIEIEYDEVSGFRVPSLFSGTLFLAGARTEYRVTLGSHSVGGGGSTGRKSGFFSSVSASGESIGISGSRNRSGYGATSSRPGDSGIGSDSEKLFKRAITYLDNGALDLALEAYTQSAVADPGILDRESRGLRETLRGRCERILTVNVTNVEAYFLLGAICSYTGKANQARSFLETASKLDTTGTYSVRIRNLLDLGDGKGSDHSGESVFGGLAVSDSEVIRFMVSGKIEGNSYASVTLESYSGNFKRIAETLEGSFRFRNIPPGIYRVYPEVGEKRMEPDGTVAVTDGIVSYESQEIEVLDGDLEGLILYRSQ